METTIITLLCESGRTLSTETAHLLRESVGFTPEDIHKIRVASKRLRAYWILAAPAVGKPVAKEHAGDLRNAARTLSGPRDDFVRTEVLTELADGARKKDRRAISLIRDELFGSLLPANLSPTEIGALGLEQTLLRDATRWDEARMALEGRDDDDLVRQGFQRTFARARDAASIALDLDTATGYHRWRRWVKYTYYQYSWVALDGDRPASTIEKRIKRLGSLLGRLHDIHQLQDDLDARSLRASSPRAFRRVRTAVLSGELDLKKEIDRLAPKVMDRKPGAVSHKLMKAFRQSRSRMAERTRGLQYHSLSSHEGDGAAGIVHTADSDLKA
ncbi:MAG: CHAD domain-containing protein [Rhodothermales bacterium]|nr:CHAD domain-containing protein [Rhodothermales bacterium]